MTTYSTSTSEEKYMTALVWDDTGNKRFEQGVDKGVIYPLNTGTSAYDTGYAWNGITTVTETPAGAASNPQYADNIKYLDLLSAETFGGDIQAFTYPDQFALMDGTESPEAGVVIGQQTRKTFGLSYQTNVGNDCLLYTSDAADDLLCVDLGGRRIIKKKKQPSHN